MVTAIALQVFAALGFVLGSFVLSGVGGAVMAAALVLFLVGWQLEQRGGS